MLPLTLLTFILWTAESQASFANSIPQDFHAYPKYSVQFLNGQPILNATAQRWLQEGNIDEDVFLDIRQSKQDSSTQYKSIASGPEESELAPATSAPLSVSAPSSSLQKMKLGSLEFLCMLSPAPEVPISSDEPEHPHQPQMAWDLLQPLEGTCLYHRQGWFSYAYCHGQYVRQFREKEPNLPFGLKTPVEDPNEPSYTLGHAPSSAPNEDETGTHVSVPEQKALANRLELARGAGHRYLNLHWGDGTVCDKTGRKREIEIQFHCAMASTDSIFFIKETRTCQYTLVIHTPRLCGEPGFKSPHDDLKDTPVRCRKIVHTLEGTDSTLPASPSPFEKRKPKPLPAPSKSDRSGGGGHKGKDLKGSEHLIQAAFDAIFGRKNNNGNSNTNAGGGNAPQGKARNDINKAEGDNKDGGNGVLGGSGNDGEGANADKKAHARDLLENNKILAVSMDENGEIQIEAVGQDGFLPMLNQHREEARAAKEGKKTASGSDDDGSVMEIELAGGEDAVRLMKILQEAGYEARFPGEDEDEEKLPSHDDL
ncbi:Protein OS-9 [Serendipita sp. 399]|nr:Protein OS-9 [Serendipita sp. 399]